MGAGNISVSFYYSANTVLLSVTELLFMEKLHKPACYSYIFKEAHMFSLHIFAWALTTVYFTTYQNRHMFILCEGWKDESPHTVQYNTLSTHLLHHQTMFQSTRGSLSDQTEPDEDPDEIPECSQTLFNGLMKVLEERYMVCVWALILSSLFQYVSTALL